MTHTAQPNPKIHLRVNYSLPTKHSYCDQRDDSNHIIKKNRLLFTPDQKDEQFLTMNATLDVKIDPSLMKQKKETPYSSMIPENRNYSNSKQTKIKIMLHNMFGRQRTSKTTYKITGNIKYHLSSH